MDSRTIPATKACTKCRQNLPLSEYHVRRASPDGLSYVCKPCKRRVSPETQKKRELHAAGLRVCPGCSVTRPIDEFWRSGKLQSWCRDCSRAYMRKTWPQRRDEHAQRSRAMRKDPKYSAQIRARSAVSHAVARGKLQRCPCSKCGTEKNVHAHHHKGYAPEHWLDVEWLCSSCHGKEHRHGAGEPPPPDAVVAR